jgi:hypothetical protein
MATDCRISYRPSGARDRAAARQDAVVRNISGSGMLFVTPAALGVGAILELRVEPGHLSIPVLSAVVEVVRSSPVRQDGAGNEAVCRDYEIGVRVVEMI